jgi:mercuric ion binding protein
MTCPTCPVTIKKALMKEQGVASVTVRYEKKELIVSFDDAYIASAQQSTGLLLLHPSGLDLLRP